MALWVVARTGGSKWQSAAPTSNLRHDRRFVEFGNSNLWFPNSCSIRRQQLGAGSACLPGGVFCLILGAKCGMV